MSAHPLDVRRQGQLHHAFIARLARQGKLDLDAFDLATEAADEVRNVDPEAQRIPKYRQAWRRGLARSANAYAVWFAPNEGQRLLGTEVAVGSVRFDIVWRRASGGVWADELKTARPPRVFDDLDEQLDAQLAAGVGEWGQQFLGVRVVLLAVPARSFFAFPDGSREVVTFENGIDEGPRGA